MHDVTVIDDPAAAEASLDPIRARLLSALAEPGSATTLAAKTGLTRQKVNYHLRALEQHGLVELVEERRKGNCNERVMQATAASYVISPTALSAVAPDPARAPDQRSARWLLGVAGRLVSEVGELITRAGAAGKPLATLGIDSEIRFASAAGAGRVRRRARRGRQRPRRQVPRRARAARARPPLRRRPASEDHQASHHHPRSRHEPRIRSHPRDRPARRPGRRLDRDHRCIPPPGCSRRAWRSPPAPRHRKGRR